MEKVLWGPGQTLPALPTFDSAWFEKIYRPSQEFYAYITQPEQRFQDGWYKVMLTIKLSPTGSVQRATLLRELRTYVEGHAIWRGKPTFLDFLPGRLVEQDLKVKPLADANPLMPREANLYITVLQWEA